jgi:hypothetical protein
LSDFDRTNAGLGGRVTFDLTDWLAIEGEGRFFPADDVRQAASPLTPDLLITYSRRRAEGFFGAKLGVRGERMGVFGKVRPGFTSLTDRGVQCEGPLCPLALLARPVYRTEFALDVGGIFEVYPSARTVARFELGDTVVRHRSQAPPCSNCTSHNFSSGLGFGVRF